MFKNLIDKYVPGIIFHKSDCPDMILEERNGYQLIIPKIGNDDNHGQFLINSYKGHDSYLSDDKSLHKYTILRGNGVFVINNKSYTVKNGDVITIEPKNIYYYKGVMLLLEEMTPNYCESNIHIYKNINYNEEYDDDAEEFYSVVNENDEVIGKKSSLDKDFDWKTMRFSNIFLEKDGKILLPKRTMRKKLFPGCFDFSAGGHTHYNETYEENIRRECKEELGIEIYDLKVIKHYNPYKNNVSSFCTNFVAKTDDFITFNTDEVDSIYYYTPEEILKMIEETPELFKSDYKLMFIDYLEFRKNNNN